MLRKIEFTLAIFFLAIMVGCRTIQLKTVPDNLVGVWSTDAPKYSGRSLELTPELLIIKTGPDKKTFYGVLAVDEEPRGKNTLYTIHYVSDDREVFQLSFFYAPQKRGTIQFEHQPGVVWTREKPKN
ncbi:MAG: hypothetical protein ACYDDI_04355 [Candidatus Acidiferrales bacterium]